MTKSIILFFLISICWICTAQANEKLDYIIYHQQIMEAETLIASENYEYALQVYEKLIKEYKFVFFKGLPNINATCTNY